MNKVKIGQSAAKSQIRCGRGSTSIIRTSLWKVVYSELYRDIIGGITNNNIINYDEDSAEIHVMTTLGALILDPTRCLAYLPSGMVPA